MHKSLFLLVSLLILGCGGDEIGVQSQGRPLGIPQGQSPTKCDDDVYPEPTDSEYILPFRKGETHPTGLSNCSSSYHSPGRPDQYAYDFDMPAGHEFLAARAGRVVSVVESESTGGGVGNYVIIEHTDRTFGLYLHSPKDGIHVEVGERVDQGQVLGVVGSTGLAGYPHLHFIVVEDPTANPYVGIPVNFNNSNPLDKILASYSDYQAD